MTSAIRRRAARSPPTREPIRASRQMRATSNATGAISGRMYCGRFDCEIEKKMNGMAIQSSR